jgi:hypothetical protein
MNNESNILKTIADNPALSDALKKLLEDQFSLEDFMTNYTNEILGSQVRACLVAREGIRNAFIKISTYKTVQPKPDTRNPAR